MITDHGFRPRRNPWGQSDHWHCGECGQGPEEHEELAPDIEARREGRPQLPGLEE